MRIAIIQLQFVGVNGAAGAINLQCKSHSHKMETNPGLPLSTYYENSTDRAHTLVLLLVYLQPFCSESYTPYLYTPFISFLAGSASL